MSVVVAVCIAYIVKKITIWTHTDDTVERMASSSLLKSVFACTAAIMSGWSCCMACIARLQHHHRQNSAFFNEKFCNNMLFHGWSKWRIWLDQFNRR